MKNNFDCKATISACLYPLFSRGVTSIGGILVMSVSNSLNISVTEFFLMYRETEELAHPVGN